jgi:hypothetical protein
MSNLHDHLVERVANARKNCFQSRKMCASCERFFCGRVGRKNEIEGIARDTRATTAGMLLQQRAHFLDCAKVNAPLPSSHQLFTHQSYGIVFSLPEGAGVPESDPI